MRKKFIAPKISALAKYGMPVALLEVFCLGYCYMEYRRLNTNAMTRYEYSKKHPMILEKYYQLGERLGSLKTREEDQERWKYYEKPIPEEESDSRM